MTRVPLFGTTFDALAMNEACAQIHAWTLERPRRSRIVVTPNVDHLVRLSKRADLTKIYNAADMVLADGQPIVWASRLFGQAVPERVAGSDLFPALMKSAGGRELRVYLLGGADGVAAAAATQVERDYPSVRIVGTSAPPFGFDKRPEEVLAVAEAVAATDADIVLVGLGSPKQELFSFSMQAKLNCGVALCLGATVDFLADPGLRAPPWMRRTGLEWTHRMASDPRRLVSRYAKNLLAFPQILMAEAVRRLRHGNPPAT